ncbi:MULTISPECIES: MauE/DoxX family redox-associated membrane protein [Pacificibacter]|uniref:MauE/DoxX family redox-associated membrane protein n=1 Tax=Pacificibacter TaxID=1042323 RepID=UPI002091577E|nr:MULTISPECIES: MauE/DoxX family redox-associated membrane protein [Pacificibacter]MDO6614718.1 glutaredoxin domain-containing protein [Pacificibacter sp. 1_MG-2023]
MIATKTNKTATLYRMVMTDHMCPYGLKSKDLLERNGFVVEDRHLTSRDEVDAFKAEHDVETTPQVFIDGKRIGGFDDLSAYFGTATKPKNATTYKPVIALFSIAALLAVCVTWLSLGTVVAGRTLEWFISISMVLLGLQKLQDVERFATMFLNYDLLAQRWVRYGYIYPFVETGAGLLMMAGLLTWLSAPAALFVASIGAISVFKAVYIDKRELKCACVGGDSNVPLGFVSLLENVMMVGMAVWMLSKL